VFETDQGWIMEAHGQKLCRLSWVPIHLALAP
jgi:hypothetical protein